MTKPLGPGEGQRVERSVIIRATAPVLYRRWRDLEGLSRLLSHVESVRDLGQGRSHWKVKGPLGRSYAWDAEIVNELENEHIGWQSLPGGDVAAAGSVHFHPAGDDATAVIVVLRYDPPGGAIGTLIASILGSDPDSQIGEDLERLKREVESDQSDIAPPDPVQEASEESFPASDPPSWTTSR